MGQVLCLFVKNQPSRQLFSRQNLDFFSNWAGGGGGDFLSSMHSLFVLACAAARAPAMGLSFYLPNWRNIARFCFGIESPS